MRDTSIPL